MKVDKKLSTSSLEMPSIDPIESMLKFSYVNTRMPILIFNDVVNVKADRISTLIINDAANAEANGRRGLSLAEPYKYEPRGFVDGTEFSYPISYFLTL